MKENLENWRKIIQPERLRLSLVEDLERRGFPVKPARPWKTLRELGQGTLGSVSLVVDPETGQQVARKTISDIIPSETQNKGALPCAWQEADILSLVAIKHIPGVVRLLGLEEAQTSGGYTYPALLLEPFLKEEGWTKWNDATFPGSSIVWFVKQVIQIVHALEKERIWLDDFKADNLFVKLPNTDTLPEIRIYDLGFARQSPSDDGRKLCESLWKHKVLIPSGNKLPPFEEVWKKSGT